MARFIELPSKNHAARDPAIAVDTLVLHHTAQPLDVSLELLRFGTVSAHYVVDVNGDIYRLVEEARVAWHAGLSWWRDARSLNATSIGVEIVNIDGNRHAYPAVQRQAVIALCRDIIKRHPTIQPRNVVGHSDIAPLRKDDPGTLFFWPELAAAGIGLWSDAPPAAVTESDAAALLRRFGYPPPHRYGRRNGRFEFADEPAAGGITDVIDVSLADIITAFQRHYRPARVDGVADAQTVARLQDLLRQADSAVIDVAARSA
ncbi:N-acetylmuramoyl-L-alanine amidase [Reyranella sp. CPCC 100927]|uniref:N-acetylmuramoyl-L-alanine amidase n=1 Tax=Reyranella sp. CPCC 100927 TaxID=2599616 RepID=UPI0011B3D700|nr:N-acetylmuramoyl-L-alanine amidase [Reyranella sp. CPCC 100927]TWT06070.1 N-acetylmuramoyl-L-alanine amidase [Reyranella sp. CPCC 100927]